MREKSKSQNIKNNFYNYKKLTCICSNWEPAKNVSLLSGSE